MFCSKCGRQVPDGSICPCQQTAPQQPQYQAPQYQAPQYQAPQYNAAPVSPAYKPAIGGLINKLSLDKIIAIALVVLTFFLSFINWFGFEEIRGAEDEMEDILECNYGPFGMDSEVKEIFEDVEDALDADIGFGVGSLSFFFVIVMIFAIINIFVFLAYIVTSIINVEKLLPALRGKDISGILHKAFYGILALCLILGLLGAIFGYYNTMDYDEDEDVVNKMSKKEYIEERKARYDKYELEYDDDDIEKWEDNWDDNTIKSSLAAGWWITLILTLIGAVLAVKPDLVSSLLKGAKAPAPAPAPGFYPQY